MEFLRSLLEIVSKTGETPGLFGWYHILNLVFYIGLGVFLCLKWKKPTDKQVRIIVFTISAIVFLMEVYKQLVYTYSVTDGVITGDFQWYAFPWQFCSMPMYVGLLVGIWPKGKIYDALCAFLGTYSVFAGACVMIYPGDVFTSLIGINIQTMICHGTMLSLGIFLLGTNYVKTEHKTILKAIPVFSAAVVIAMILNEVAHYTDFTKGETFNMFFISPHEAPSLPVYSIVQQYVPYPWCLIIYILAFSIAGYLMLLIAMGIKALCRKIKKK